jgi:hypothetical protein
VIAEVYRCPRVARTDRCRDPFGRRRHGSGLARCATGVMDGKFDVAEAGLINQAGRKASKAMRDVIRRRQLIVKVPKVSEKRRRVDRVTSITLQADHFKRLDDRDWTVQLLAAANAHTKRPRKGGG